LSSPLVIKNS